MRVKKKTVLICFIIAFIMVGYLFFAAITQAADSNTVSSTVIDKSVGTANAPGININQNDSLNCERIKLARVLGQSGLRVASVSVLCGDPSGRVFDAMWRAGTTCPFGSLLDQGLIGEEAKVMWIKNSGMIPEGSHFKKMIEQEKLAKAEKKKAANKVKKKKLKEKKVTKDETSTSKKGGLLLSIVTILLIL